MIRKPVKDGLGNNVRDYIFNPVENIFQHKDEFVMAENIQMNDSWLKELMDYIDKNSNLSVEWIDREHFVEPSMCGFRLVKKKDVN